MPGYRALVLAGLASIGAGLPAWALEDADSQTLQQIVVVGTTPVPGMSVDLDKVPGNVQTLSSADLRQDGTSSLINGLSIRLGSVSINDTMADAFQPDILYRGFAASPVLGTPQGLAVYQNGVRINEAFGDTVNWDLFPDIAVNRVDIVSSNPLFGLNALGGAVSVTMKNGFTFQGTDGELSGGSFNQRQGAAEFGANNGVFGIYAAARLLNQDGWRLFSQDSVRQYYMDVSFHPAGASIDLSYARADNQLFGQGAAPVQSLAINPQNVFTGPQNNFNRLDFVTLNTQVDLTETLAAQSVLYAELPAIGRQRRWHGLHRLHRGRCRGCIVPRRRRHTAQQLCRRVDSGHLERRRHTYWAKRLRTHPLECLGRITAAYRTSAHSRAWQQLCPRRHLRHGGD